MLIQSQILIGHANDRSRAITSRLGDGDGQGGKFGIDREIEHERRVGYAWYVQEPAKLLQDEYPKWRDRINKIKQD